MSKRARSMRSAVAGAAALTTLVGLVTVVPAPGRAVAEAVFPFVLESAAAQPATGTPMPASGKHAALVRNTSAATTTVEGSGRVVLGAIASNCEGWPTLRVTVDGTVRGDVRIEHTSQYGAHVVGTPVGPGRHTVRISLLNDYMTSATCDRNAFLASAEMEYPLSAAFGTAVLFPPSRIAALKERVAAETAPTFTAWNALRAVADANLTREPAVPSAWMVPWAYGPDAAKGAEMVAKLRDQANAAYRLALAYRMSGDERYAVASARQITTWIRGVQSYSTAEDSSLAFAVNFPLMIVAADLLRPSTAFPAATQQEFGAYLRTRAFAMSTISHENNWGNWGLLLEVAAAAYLGDRMKFDQAATRWKYFVANQIAADGQMPRELNRPGDPQGYRGVWYTSFALHPQTLAAEIMRVNGLDLFYYRSPNGRTLRLAYERLVGWVHDPATYPYPAETGYAYHVGHWELLNLRWPNAKADTVLGWRRPVKDDSGSVGMTFTHGGLL
ncbi:alginate lyase family protein [Actinoplanes sp. NPDC023801]|uniref:alginate lyase family protein n=1 Tax=Actinoplanes sp. NPDC023801 TaxID=3154595 RepID=UPI00340ACC13